MKSEEIAKIVGVSRSTVSRVINNYDNVPEATRIKVLAAIEQYNYSPNAYARTLAGKKSDTIGVFFVIDDQPTEESKFVYNDFYTTYLDDIVDIANKKGYYVLVQSIFHEDDYEKVTKAFREKRIDGGIIIGTRNSSLEKIHTQSFTKPLVVIDYEVDKLHPYHKAENITIINTLDKKASYDAVCYLADAGCHEIGFIKGIEATLSARQRFEGYSDAMKDLGLTMKDAYVLEGDFNQKTAYNAMEKAVLANKVAQGYVCANDYMAIAAMNCLQHHGLSIPKDVSFIGFDNTRAGQLIQTKLTTLSPDFYEIAKKAVETIDHYEKDTHITQVHYYEYPMSLIPRESVRKEKNNVDECTSH